MEYIVPGQCWWGALGFPPLHTQANLLFFFADSGIHYAFVHTYMYVYTAQFYCWTYSSAAW